MARNTVEAWLPEEYDSKVLQIIGQTSAVDALASHVSLGSDTKHVPRTAAVSVDVVPKGSAYGEDVAVNDEVLLNVRKFGKVIRIAEEDIDDSIVNILETKKAGWATAFAKTFDNAALGVTAAENGTTVPFTSVYRALSQTNATTGYTANAGIIKTLTTVAPTYANLRAVIALYEGSDFFDPTRTFIIAHPAFKDVLRGIVDTQGRPIFIENPTDATVFSLFGYPVRFSLGAVASAVASGTPTGNKLMVIGNADFLIVGDRSGPESVVIDGRDGASALTDETLLKMRARKAFVIGHEKAFAIFEIVP